MNFSLQVLLANKLDGDISLNYTTVAAPLLLSHITLIFMSFGAKGGNRCKPLAVYTNRPFSWNNQFIIIQKTLKFISYLTTCRKTNYKILQPFARSGKLLNLQEKFISLYKFS